MEKGKRREKKRVREEGEGGEVGREEGGGEGKGREGCSGRGV